MIVSKRGNCFFVRGWLGYPEQQQRLSKMPVPFIAALYAQLLRCFPLKDQPDHTGAHSYDALDNAYDLHRKLLNILESAGKLRELRAIYAANPELGDAWWTGSSLERARSRAHAQLRTAPSVADFVRFFRRKAVSLLGTTTHCNGR